MATIFSRIVSGEIPCYKIAEDDKFFAFLDINPLVKGHTLVIPKQETDCLFDMSPVDLGEMIQFAQIVAVKIKENIACNRVGVVVLGLDVPHAHIHLIPINSSDDINFSREKLRLTSDEFFQIQELLVIE